MLNDMERSVKVNTFVVVVVKVMNRLLSVRVCVRNSKGKRYISPPK